MKTARCVRSMQSSDLELASFFCRSSPGFTVLAHPLPNLRVYFCFFFFCFFQSVFLSFLGFYSKSAGWIRGAFGLASCVPWRCAGSEQLIQVDGWYGLPPVAERAEFGHEEGLVLLFAQQRKHVLHQLAQPAVTTERTEKLCNVSRVLDSKWEKSQL